LTRSWSDAGQYNACTTCCRIALTVLGPRIPCSVHKWPGFQAKHHHSRLTVVRRGWEAGFDLQCTFCQCGIVFHSTRKYLSLHVECLHFASDHQRKDNDYEL
ncbi:unnamed protein product, partial [Ectocarpus sp. 12 AP-2014]